MERRSFIRLTGGTLSSLLFTNWTAAPGASPLQLELPSKVFAGLEDGEYPMERTTLGTYHYKSVVAKPVAGQGSMALEIGSPVLPLRYIRLEWSYPERKDARVLGDHWERTYGDVGFVPADFDKKMPWYFIAQEGQSASCFGVKTGCSSICHWQAGEGRLSLTMDLRNGGSGVLLGDRLLKAAEIVVARSEGSENIFATGRRFCGLLCEKPRLAHQPVYGINDWYYAYGNNNPELILRQTALMTDLAPSTDNRPFSLVDAGWAYYSPLLPGDGAWMDDFSRPNDKFPDMGKLAGDIRNLGMRAGLWTRPLCGAHDDPKSLMLSSIPGRDDPKSPVLDPSIDANIGRVRRNIRLYREWGYEMVKHDFTTYDILGKWGFQMKDDLTAGNWHFNDRSKTTAEIMLQLYHAIREAAGEMYVIGCNTMSHLSAGIFELNRVGDDTSGKEWARTRKMGVNTLGFRMIQHDIFYAADGDCVGLTKDIPWDKNEQWMRLVAGSGTPLFISTQPDALGPEQRRSIQASFTLAARKQPAGEPLDWLTNHLPGEWKLGGQVRKFDWG